jgi:phosphatidate cytidylyltransferase
MLRQRVITAVVLLALTAAGLFASSPLPFALFTGVLISAAGWEWARLNGAAPWARPWLSGALLARPVWRQSAAAAVVGPRRRPVECGPAGLDRRWRAGAARRPRGLAAWPPLLRLGPGLGLLCLAWLALAQRAPSASTSCCRCCAWSGWPTSRPTSGGRAFGRNKLAPTISPGKTWEGVYGGVAGVLLLALGWIALESTANWARPGLFDPAGGPASVAWRWRRIAVRPRQRGRRSVRIPGQARRRGQGQQPAAARPRRGARPHRRAAARVPLRGLQPRTGLNMQRVCHPRRHRLDRRQHAGRDGAPSGPLPGLRPHGAAPR